jgi:hypothetical protein
MSIIYFDSDAIVPLQTKKTTEHRSMLRLHTLISNENGILTVYVHPEQYIEVTWDTSMMYVLSEWHSAFKIHNAP